MSSPNKKEFTTGDNGRRSPRADSIERRENSRSIGSLLIAEKLASRHLRRYLYNPALYSILSHIHLVVFDFPRPILRVLPAR